MPPGVNGVLQDCFKGVIGSDTMWNSCKPELPAFDAAIRHIGAVPGRTAMFEDSVKNLQALSYPPACDLLCLALTSRTPCA
jgi:FMN phosphatase YigB (HAD superfamily)